MSEIVDRIYSIIKRHPVYSFLLSACLLALVINVLSNFLSQKYGAYNAMAIVAIALILSILAIPVYSLVEYWKKSKKIKYSELIPKFEPLEKKYKGLIVSISKIDEDKEELINKINSIESLNDVEGLNKLYELRGIGQTFRAIIHHLRELEVCWLLYTEGSMESKEVVGHFIKKFGSRTVKSIPIIIENPNDIKSIYKVINEIYVKGLEEVNLHETEVIADITGGTRPISSAIILACTSSDRNIEYVEQDTNALIKVEHI